MSLALPSARLLQLCQGDHSVGQRLIAQLELALEQSADQTAEACLLATQTFYALLTKLLATLAVCRAREIPFGVEHAELWPWLAQIESGEWLLRAGIATPPIDDPYRWYLEARSEPLAAVIGELIDALQPSDLHNSDSHGDDSPSGKPAGESPEALADDLLTDDLLKAIYHRLIPREVRHARGEYYTPHWLAEHLLDLLEYPRARRQRLLDPACGSGTFLLAAIARCRQAARREPLSAAEQLRLILHSVVGIDLDPLAVLAARANYLLAISDLLPAASGRLELPVYQADSLLDPLQEVGRFDCIAGNPPWVGWESLGEAYRRRTRELWEQYGLFAHSGMATILGSGKKDLSLLMSYSVTDRLLRTGGRLGFIITQSAFKTLGAGQGFRNFAWTHAGMETQVQVERVDDMTDFQPFEIAGTRTALFVWRKGSPTSYPVPYHLWQKTSRGKSIPADATLEQARRQTRQLPQVAQPIDPSEPNSSWLTAPAAVAGALRGLWGRSPYQAHEGANTGGANGVYWLEVLGETAAGRVRVRNLIAGAKKKVPQVEVELEEELLHPLLRGREVRRWQAAPHAMLLMVQDPVLRRGREEASFARQFPLAYAYLKSCEPMLRRRAAYRRYFTRTRQGTTTEKAPFYSMFNIGPATFAPVKVVWHRMVAPLGAVVVGSQAGKPILPQETHSFIACHCEDEAYFVAGLLNSTPLNYAAMAFSQAGGKSFGSPQILNHLYVPQYQPADEGHRLVERCARECQRTGEPPATLLAKLDRAAADVWGLDTSATQCISRAMAQLRKLD